MVLRPDAPAFGGLGGLSIRELRIGRRAVLAASGEVDIATADRMCRAVAHAAESGALDLWFDLSEVTFLDSSGVHALVAARDDALARGASFVVICPYGPVLRVLRIAGLDRRLLIYPDRASAHEAC
jgi:anti-sigma B factor antagonist